MAPGTNGLFYLDLDLHRGRAGSSRPKSSRHLPPLPPARCFSQQDLYTTVFAGIPNDEIERLLFGRIDNEGAIAVKALAANDLSALTKRFQEMFDYISAKQLRTPKGLDWLKGNYQRLDQLELMLELQALRQMNCTTWFECVREVVSASESTIKFIVSDHPVTTFNPGLSLDSPELDYPNDPPIDWKGTQTIFPLDANHCLILTNLEYAKDAQLADMTARRTHARAFGDTIARTDNTIVGRKLSDLDVRSINKLIAWRAKRYIGSSNREWLDQSLAGPPDLTHLAAALRPPEEELWHYGGTVYVGFADGTSKSWDEFGRTEPEREFLKKPPRETPPAPSDACPCSSARTYAECCESRDERDRMPWDVWSIRDRNLRFIDAAARVLGLMDGKSWDDVRREISGDQVRKIHVLFEAVWPPDQSLASLLPRPDARRLRGMYLGLIDARTITYSVTSWLQYFDEIVAIHPFSNARIIRPEYSPIESPDQHKAQTLKNVMLLLVLQPFIEQGWIHLVPDPIEFNSAIRQTIFSLGDEYRSGRPSPLKQDPELEALAKDDFERSLQQLSDSSLRSMIRKSSPDIPDAKLDGVVSYMRRMRAKDPLALLQDGYSTHGELMMMRGVSIPIGLFLAHLTGAVPYSDLNTWWGNLKDFAIDAQDNASDANLPIAEAFKKAFLLFATDHKFLRAARDLNSYKGFRAAIRDIRNSFSTTQPDGAQIQLLATRLSENVSAMERDAPKLCETFPEAAVYRRKMECAAPMQGLSMRESHRLLLAFGHGRHAAKIPIALLGGKPQPLEASLDASGINNDTF
jgi:Protein of unknown function (DUF4238)/SEC-C motif